MGFEIPTHYSHSLTTLSGPVISFLGKIKFQSVTDELSYPRHGHYQQNSLSQQDYPAAEASLLVSPPLHQHTYLTLLLSLLPPVSYPLLGDMLGQMPNHLPDEDPNI